MNHEAAMADVMATHIRILRGAIELAVEKSASDAVAMIAEYFEECGVEDEETRKLLDAWWTKSPEMLFIRRMKDRPGRFTLTTTDGRYEDELCENEALWVAANFVMGRKCGLRTKQEHDEELENYRREVQSRALPGIG